MNGPFYLHQNIGNFRLLVKLTFTILDRFHAAGRLSHASSTSRRVRYSPNLAVSFSLSTRKVSPGNPDGVRRGATFLSRKRLRPGFQSAHLRAQFLKANNFGASEAGQGGGALSRITRFAYYLAAAGLVAAAEEKLLDARLLKYYFFNVNSRFSWLARYDRVYLDVSLAPLCLRPATTITAKVWGGVGSRTNAYRMSDHVTDSEN